MLIFKFLCLFWKWLRSFSFSSLSNTAIINNCVFDTCNGNWLGGVGIEKRADQCILCLRSISNVNAKEYGASLVLKHIDNVITVSECYFMNSIGNRTDSGVYFFHQNKTDRFQFNFNRFVNNCYEHEGIIYFHRDYLDEGWYNKDNYLKCVISNNDKDIVECGIIDNEYCDEIIYLDYFTLYTYSPLTIDSSVGIDEFNCGLKDSDTLCRTLSYALKSFFIIEYLSEVFIQNEAFENTVLTFRIIRVYVNSVPIPSEKNNRSKLSLKKDES